MATPSGKRISAELYEIAEPVQEAIDQTEESIKGYERNCLGAALLYNWLLRSVLLPLEVAHFKLEDHQNAFRTMLELVEEGGPPFESGALVDAMVARGRPPKASEPLAYFESLIDGAMLLDDPKRPEKLESALHYRVGKIIEDYANRQLSHAGGWVRNETAKPGADPRQIRQQLGVYLSNIDSIIDNAASTKPKSIEITRRDMPDAVLDGPLGEICQKRMKDFPLAYSWPTLLGIAGASARLKQAHRKYVRGNLFICVVGPVGSGKTTALEHALYVLGIDESDSVLLPAKYGSAEGLAEALKDLGSCVRVLAPDELLHLLVKCNIDRASFPTVLTTAFNKDQQNGGTKKDPWEFDCRLSIIGGLVEDRFEDAFGSTSLGGLYDRFLFGLAPEPHNYDYYPPKGEAEVISPFPPEVDNDVWDVRNQWKQEGISGRVAEMCIRAAWICAAVEGRPLLRGADLGPARALAEYQMKVRKVLAPNPGQTPDAQCGASIMKWLREHAADGQWVKRRTLSKGIHSERLGAGIFNRALQNLQYNDELLLDDKKREVKLRLEDSE